MPKRTNANTLKAYWSKRENDLVFHHPDFKWNGHLLYGVMCSPQPHIDYSNGGRDVVFGKSFVQELEARGYDITTLRFSVCKKEVSPQEAATEGTK